MSEYKWKPFTLLVSAEEVKGNEMTKFNVGDKYRFNGGIDVEGIYFTKGKEYLISCENRSGEPVLIDNLESDHPWGIEEFNECFSKIEPSPIRTVTRREIVPGVYGRIKITGTYQGNRVTMDWDRSDIITAAVPIVGMSAEELREAAHLLNQIAEVLEENGE